MTSRVSTVAFQGIEAVLVDVQAQFVSGQVQFHVVGLPDKAVAESRERVRAALHSIGLALPGKRFTHTLFSMKIIVVLLLLLILGSMASALVFLTKDGGKTRRSVRALTVRISLSLALFLLLLFGYYMGWFVPNQRPF